MPQMILRVAIALVAFGAGVTASTLYSAIFGSALSTPRVESFRPARRHGCSKSFRSMSELPPPPPVVMPAAPDVPALPEVQVVPAVPPPPAATRPIIKKRVTIKLSDGTVSVVESTAETAERKR